MGFIQRVHKQLIPIGIRLKAIVRSIYHKMSRVLYENPISSLQQKTSRAENLTKPKPPIPASSKDQVGKIQFFPVDEEVASIPDISSEFPNHLNSLNKDQTQSTGRILEGIKARTNYVEERRDLLRQGQAIYAGKRLLFILPIAATGGGANLILLAARTMRQMHVDAQIYNLSPYRMDFEQAYPDNDVPMVYGAIENLPKMASRFDAVVATSYITVYWLNSIASIKPDLVIGYYIQDYEPYFDEPGSQGYEKAAASYTLFPNLVRCCTTPWINDEIQQQHSGNKQHIPVTVLGASLDIDLFMPRPRHDVEWPNRSLRVAAMIRPSTSRRNPQLTMELMERASQELGDRIELILFGADLDELQQAHMPLSFPFKLTGRLNQKQVANLMNEVDIFVDYSAYQGLGLTALEAMACGVASVVPARGGTDVYARHEENCLVVDTQDKEACFSALTRLVRDDELRLKLQRNGLLFTPRFYPELPTFRLLQALWSQNQGIEL